MGHYQGLELRRIGLFLLTYGHLYLPRWPVRAAGPTLTVMTYNVLYTVTDAAPIAANVTGANPDLIAFQELTPNLAQQL
ncbi:MAG: hypothetical protein KAX26_04635, partial [Anaerolineae bacterium]|nr:hypothetical protein [Anaerolineae bacterium]